MRRELVEMSCIVATTLATTVAPRCATELAVPASWAAMRAVAALVFTVPENSSIADAVC